MKYIDFSTLRLKHFKDHRYEFWYYPYPDTGEYKSIRNNHTDNRYIHPDEYFINNLYSIENPGDKLGYLHRIDGPAFIDFENKRLQWRIRGFLHRIDGPAIIDKYGEKYYYLKNKGLKFEKWFYLLTYDQKIAALYNPENFQ